MRKVSNAQPRIYLRLLRNKVGPRWQPDVSMLCATELVNVKPWILGLDCCPHSSATRLDLDNCHWVQLLLGFHLAFLSSHICAQLYLSVKNVLGLKK